MLWFISYLCMCVCICSSSSQYSSRCHHSQSSHGQERRLRQQRAGRWSGRAPIPNVSAPYLVRAVLVVNGDDTSRVSVSLGLWGGGRDRVQQPDWRRRLPAKLIVLRGGHTVYLGGYHRYMSHDVCRTSGGRMMPIEVWFYYIVRACKNTRLTILLCRTYNT